MRIIAGDAHGRRLRAPRGLSTRPATARVRASIFSRLASRMEFTDARVLDLFAGSGSLGIEALSRGARSAVFVDSSRAAAAVIRDNLRVLKLAERAEVIVAGVERALAQLGTRGDRFDLVFVDAPYRHDISAAVLAELEARQLVEKGGWVMVRQEARTARLTPATLEEASCATLGGHRLTLYHAATVR
jgi:16S rRNA (guanine(966)-N(2))-methyltransferase RsmD